MKTDGMSDSTENVEDRRGQSGGGVGRTGFPMGGAGLKLGIPGIIIALIAMFFGGQAALNSGDGGGGFGEIFNQIPSTQSQAAPANANAVPGAPLAADDPARFSVQAFNDVQAYWQKQFSASGDQYRATTLVLYDNQTPTGCGTGQAAAGPFYCPADEKVYIDLSFMDELNKRFKAPGDFAWAYVIAHEVGHHVQNITGIERKVRQEQQRTGKVNELSVRLELQADCLAGAWGNGVYSRDLLDGGDLEEAITAASRVGDDYIQKNLGGGRVNPDSFTHGTSAQRTKWFKKGFESGDPNVCDTFSGGI